jgi:pyruvate dehydrogenase E2 component (dihydrolipoamide acetyltransferase)
MELVAMPQLGETVTEGTITRWLKQVGDEVAVDDVLFEVSTEKVDTEVPSAHAGVLREIYVPEGDTVPVGTPLAAITETADEPLTEPARVPADVGERGAGDAGKEGPAREDPPQAGGPGAGGSSGDRTRSERFLSPVVRQLLDDHGLDPAAVVGSGRDGRITRSDVLAAAANGRRTGDSPENLRSDARPAALPPAQPGPDDEIVEFTRARRMTAENMVRSVATSVHTLVGTEVDYHQLEPARTAAGLSYLPFVARAVVDALDAFPHLNASVGEDALIVHRRVHLGVAVDLDQQALVVPVVHDAGDKRLQALSDAIAEVAARARAKRLGADDLTGGTFTITNVGRYGTVVTAPIINQPQVAILSTDGVRMRPVAVQSPAGEWVIAVHPVGNLSLTFDHRAVDGAYAAGFLARVRELLESRDWSQEL